MQLKEELGIICYLNQDFIILYVRNLANSYSQDINVINELGIS